MSKKAKKAKKDKSAPRGIRAAVGRAAQIVPNAVAAAGQRVARLKPRKGTQKKAKAGT